MENRAATFVHVDTWKSSEPVDEVRGERSAQAALGSPSREV